jgi:large subunit ribosomal protein L21
MTYAIIETGGKQLRVEPGRFYDVDRLGVETDSPYNIDKVLLINHDDGITVGRPFIEGAIVEGMILEHRRGRKILVYKMRPKKKTRKKRGHRQELTRLMITAIKVDGSVIAETELDAVSMAATQASDEDTTASTEEE